MMPLFRLLALLFLIGVTACTQDSPVPVSTSKQTPTPEHTFLNQAPDVSYVGDQECAICHRSLSNTFHQTGMGRSFYLPTSENIIENYDHPDPVYDPQTRSFYQAFRKNNTFYQREFRKDTNDRLTHNLVRQVKYIIGSGNHNRSYIMEENGFLFEMPLTWYRKESIWDLSPGYHAQNLRFSRPIVLERITCHNSYVQHQPYSQNRYTHVPHGIGCERCHGPGEHHVNLHEQGLDSEPIDRTIVNPEHLSANQKIDICLQCHLQGTMRVLKKDHTETDFRPGQSLQDLKSIFILAGLPPGDFGIASHGERFLSSVCYQKSKMGCTYCHDPHLPVQTVSRPFFNERCTTCHETLSPATQTVDHRPGADCVACHMRQGATADILHVNFTDHWIRKKIPEHPQSVVDSLQKHRTNTPIVLKSFFPETGTAADLRLGIAYIKYYESKHAHPEYLRRGIALLKSGLPEHPDHARGHYFLGLAYTHRERLPQAAHQFQKVIALSPEHGLAHFQLGRTLQKMNRSQEAIRTYRTALRIFPENPKAHNNLGNIYSSQGDLDQAQAAYEQAIFWQSDYALAYNNLGDLLAYKKRDLKSAAQQFGNALQYQPDFPAALFNLGNIRLAENKKSQAVALFQQALRVDPNYVPALGNLSVLFIGQGENEAARKHLNHLLQIAPDDQRAHDLLERLDRSEQK